MIRILAIADDLSGAAEIAGVGWRFGLATRMLRDRRATCAAGLTVIDSDSRLLEPSTAARAVHELVRDFDPCEADLIYKKTDSAFRGPMRAEIESLMGKLHFSAAVLVPQNPARGRAIRDGEYRIDGVPLGDTSFANDPDHPARSSDVLRLLGPSEKHAIACLAPDSSPLAKGVTIGEAWDEQSLRHWADRIASPVLPAGGAEFFSSILQSRGLRVQQAPVTHLPGRRRLFVVGSASAYSRELIARAAVENVTVLPMPDDVFGGADVVVWASTVQRALTESPRALIAITQAIDPERTTSQRLQVALAELVAHVLPVCPVDHLFLEGGATASAVCRRMGWGEFEMRGELATGVVLLQIPSPHNQSLLIKPGSYPWPDCIWH